MDFNSKTCFIMDNYDHKMPMQDSHEKITALSGTKTLGPEHYYNYTLIATSQQPTVTDDQVLV